MYDKDVNIMDCSVAPLKEGGFDFLNDVSQSRRCGDLCKRGSTL